MYFWMDSREYENPSLVKKSFICRSDKYFFEETNSINLLYAFVFAPILFF